MWSAAEASSPVPRDAKRSFAGRGAGWEEAEEAMEGSWWLICVVPDGLLFNPANAAGRRRPRLSSRALRHDALWTIRSSWVVKARLPSTLRIATPQLT
jgi:hypothetical protein